MNTLLKISKIPSSLLFRPKIEITLLKQPILINNSIRTNYTFNLNNKLVKYRRATRPKKTTDHSISLNYEQTQFAEKIGVTKSWNSWNTCKHYILRHIYFQKKNVIFKFKFFFI